MDAGVIGGAWLATHWGWQQLARVGTLLQSDGLSTSTSMAPLVGMLWVAVFGFCRVYESRRMLGLAAELQVVLKAHRVAVLALLLIATSYGAPQQHDVRVFLPSFALGSGVLLLGYRVSLRIALRSLRAHGVNLRRVLAVGEGTTMQGLIARLETYPELGLRVVGVVTDQRSTTTSICTRPVIGHFDEVSELVHSAHADEVLIAMPPSQSQQIDHVLELLKDETLDIRVVPDVHRYITLGCQIDEFDGTPIVRINDSPLVGLGAFAKRATDVVLSAVGLVELSPLLLLIALAIKLTSASPIIYRQERMGLDGRSFEMLKFRSMRVDAESKTGAVWCQPTDNRRTAIGSFLRRTSLDELPQLWNVLCGDMSLVGPRPERPVFVNQFRK